MAVPILPGNDRLQKPPATIRDSDTLFRHYNQLTASTVVCTRIRLKIGEEHLLTDLAERGVTLIPSATAQLASRSKVFQTRLFSEYMLPGTRAIYDIHTLLETISFYQKQKINRVVLKRERKNGGLGVHIFPDIEDVYNQVTGGVFSLPFVIQPFQPDSRDIRVIILDDYLEAYERRNDCNFRKNLHCGGQSIPVKLNEELISFCREIMARGRFAYAHIDLLLTEKLEYWLTEINLRGGLRGAKISGEIYKKKIESIHERLLSNLRLNKDDSEEDTNPGGRETVQSP
jgi:glutathione synthase/RimK-type ligase-like ATP-grasp enzyme